MRVAGERTFAAPRETVWGVLNDPGQMAKLMPGVESFDIEDFARLHAKGTGVGALMDMDTEFNLSETDGATAMAWEADVRIAGPVGSMGQRVLQPIVNQQVENVLTALDKQVASST
jgi:carbon monoxide dehydrogenase subunit G